MRTERAQTAHDFAVGVGVFLLTVAFVFSTLPTVTAPFASHDDGEAEARADRVATSLLQYLAEQDHYTELEAGRAAAFVRSTASTDELRTFLGLPSRVTVAVSVRNDSGVVRIATNGSVVPLAAGRVPADRPSRSAERVVTFAEEPVCRPSCVLRVVVGVS